MWEMYCDYMDGKGGTMFPVIDKRATGINIRRIMDECGITVKELQEYLCLGSVQSVYHWLNGISMPTIDNLYAMSELFQVTVDEILCGNRKLFTLKAAWDKSEYGRIFAYYRRLSERAA